MTIARIIRAPLLNPQSDGTVEWIPDAALAADVAGGILFAGPFAELQNQLGQSAPAIDRRSGILIPAMFDNHIHVPQHPIRGHFMDGITGNPPGGRLLAGLNRNVFPVEAKGSDEEWTRKTILDFLADTRANGVIGGATYVTVHAAAARLALELLPETWLVGLVLMNQNCPEYLRTAEVTFDEDVAELVRLGGSRLILTDRFAVACDAPLRTRAAALAQQYDLRMQTHLNEQLAEKRAVEQQLYPGRGTYTDIYSQDGLLSGKAIMAHCIWMSDHEFGLVRDAGAAIAHCPTSNTLLGSGIMPLDVVRRFGIEYAICTDVGASPTTSLLCEMAQFLMVHSGRSVHATASEALHRTTLAAAKMLGMDGKYGSFAPGKALNFVEIDPGESVDFSAVELEAEEVIRRYVLGMDAIPPPMPEVLKLAKGDVTATEARALATDVWARMERLKGKVRGLM